MAFKATILANIARVLLWKYGPQSLPITRLNSDFLRWVKDVSFRASRDLHFVFFSWNFFRIVALKMPFVFEFLEMYFCSKNCSFLKIRMCFISALFWCVASYIFTIFLLSFLPIIWCTWLIFLFVFLRYCALCFFILFTHLQCDFVT